MNACCAGTQRLWFLAHCSSKTSATWRSEYVKNIVSRITTPVQRHSVHNHACHNRLSTTRGTEFHHLASAKFRTAGFWKHHFGTHAMCQQSFVLKNPSLPVVQRFHPQRSFVASVNDIQRRLLSTKKSHDSVSSTEDANEEDSAANETITLVGPDDKVYGHKTKAEALLIAKKQGLKIVQVENPAAAFGKKYPVYKLTAKLEFRDDEVKSAKKDTKNSSPRTIKKLVLSDKIETNDVLIKLNSVKKWLKKDNEVHITITGSSRLEQVYQQIEKEIKLEARITQKKVKTGYLRFTILPLPPTTTKQ